MPIYNGVEFIQESVPSILQQKVEEWELFIGINGHPPNSTVYKTVANYLATLKDDRIHLVDFPDCKGKSATLNKMVPLCQYPYIALLDVDDIWLPGKLAAQLPWCGIYDVIGTKCIYFGDLNNIVPATPSGDISAFNFLQVNPVINSSALIRKELAVWNSKWDGVEDYNLWLCLWKEGRRFYNDAGVYVKHRIHQSSAFNAKGNNDQAERLRREVPHRTPH